MRSFRLFLTALSSVVVCAIGHVTLSPPEVKRNSYVVTAVRVPHGCDGSPTTGITVKIPDGVTNVKPQSIPGWTVTTTSRPLIPPIVSHGKSINNTVDTVSFSQGPVIDDSQFFDFNIMWKSPDAVTRLLFAVNQTCVNGFTSWSEIPTNASESVPHPAAGVSVVDPPSASVTPAAATGKNSALGVVTSPISAAIAAIGALFVAY